MGTEIIATTLAEAEQIARDQAEVQMRRCDKKWYQDNPGVVRTEESIAKMESRRPAIYQRLLEKELRAMKSVVEIVPILLPILDAPEHSEYETGMLNLGLSVYNAGVRTRVLTLTDCRRVGFVKAFNGGMQRIFSGSQWYTAEDIEYTWRYVCLLSADICHEQEDWLKRLIEVADSDPTFGIVGSGQKCGTSPQKNAKPGMPAGYEIVDHLAFCGGIIRREVFDKIGLLNEIYYHYAADYEFVHLAQEAGFKAVWVHDVYAEHDWQPDAIPEWVEHDRPLYYSRWGKDGKRKSESEPVSEPERKG